MEKNSKIYVAGHRGLVGSALVRNLRARGYENLVLKTRPELNLVRQKEVEDFFAAERPDYVFLAAARVGGIHANNTYRADFIRDNLLIQTNVIDAAYRAEVKRLMFLGSSCIYPKGCPQPMKEEYLLTGPLEPTNEPYAVAKIAGINMCDSYNRQYGTNYVSVMPTNLYGPEDNFDLENSHVLPALIRKFHEAKINGAPSVEIWGSGQPRREFLYVDDMADACLFVMEQEGFQEMVNIGTGTDVTILELAQAIQEVVGFDGELTFDASKPDGVMKKLQDVSRLTSLGWTAPTDLKTGLALSYDWYLENEDRAKK
ncbi:MAG: GDP-fucose synthetase [Myxococcales bacterium]|nr:GDP-fucose synthetase [Myxococcales bacterium]